MTYLHLPIKRRRQYLLEQIEFMEQEREVLKQNINELYKELRRTCRTTTTAAASGSSDSSVFYS
jgi:hypothetical protein